MNLIVETVNVTCPKCNKIPTVNPYLYGSWIFTCSCKERDVLVTGRETVNEATKEFNKQYDKILSHEKENA